MRLIDADKLKVLVAVENDGTMGTGKLITELFDGMETVEAIPIEWLKKHLPKYDDYIHTRMYHDEYNENIYSAGHEDGWEACRKAILEDVFEEWKEENEIY